MGKGTTSQRFNIRKVFLGLNRSDEAASTAADDD